MTNKADLQKIYFHNYTKHARPNNPTFISSLVNDSLTLFTPHKNDPGCQTNDRNLAKNSEYKSKFEPLKDSSNIFSGPQVMPHNYAKYSKDAFEKSRSYLSQYGSNLLSPNITSKI